MLPNEVAFSSGASLAMAMASSAEVSCSCLEYVGLRTALGNRQQRKESIPGIPS